ncbi:C-type lectin lectoxin-Lio3-like [Mizuhopecten yessoensis]|uniref:C-type lectin lectoxin-Lio3-like n=1 Tax=Mizuhopecten yessoensis TaxID=6573 RepID=UPI000B4585B9|nr:C-type lectin lectoxin-Lio3-like [Mizuhopecten yessoensis]
MYFLSGIVITIFIQVGMLGAPPQCHHGWIYHNNSCYFLSRDTETWVEAFSYCEIYDSQLVSITDVNENDFLKAELRKRHTTGNQFPRFDSDLNICYFTSGTDAPVEGHWEWTPTGDPFTFTDWKVGEPNNSGGMENCLCLYKAHGFQWNDRNCHSQDHFICKAQSSYGSEIIG